MLKDAVDLEGKRAEAVAVVMQEGLANICFVGEWRTVVKQRIDYSVPKKRQGGASDYDKVSLQSVSESSAYSEHYTDHHFSL